MDGYTQTAGGRRGNRWRIVGWGAAAALLATPFVAMRFTSEVDWSAFDFIVMGVLLGSVGLGLELAARRSGDVPYRIAFGIMLLLSFLLIVINGAVGVIGSEDEPANLLFGGVLLAAVGGAIVARLRPARMAAVMTVAALAQFLVPVAAWALFPDARASIIAREVIVLTGVFTILWLLSAALFRKAAARG